MKQLFFIVLFTLASSYNFGQQSQYVPPTSIHCQNNIDEIMSVQAFDIDDPIAEDARYIVFDLWNYLDDFYTGITTYNKEMMIQAISDVEKTKIEAENLGLDLSMFQEDFEVVNAKKNIE